MNRQPCRYRNVYIFGGRSLSGTELPPYIRFFPPARSGDFDRTQIPVDTIVVFIDGLFFHSPAVTHFELLRVLAQEKLVIGAASMGALRAVELRHLGMVGVGSAYDYYLSGKLTDDSELAEAICPYTFQAMTIPLIRVRRVLALAAIAGVANELLEEALAASISLHFLERTPQKLVKLWACVLPVFVVRLLRELLGSSESDVKADDARCALETALALVSDGNHRPTFKVSQLYLRGNRQ